MYVISPDGITVNNIPLRKGLNIVSDEVWEKLKNHWYAKRLEVMKDGDASIDYESMTFLELKKIASSKGINTYRMKKADLIAALTGLTEPEEGEGEDK